MKKSLLGSFLILILILSAGHSEIESEDCDALRKENDQLKKDLQLANQEAAKQAQLAMKAAEEAQKQKQIAVKVAEEARRQQQLAEEARKQAERANEETKEQAALARKNAEMAIAEREKARQRVQFVLDSIKKKN